MCLSISECYLTNTAQFRKKKRTGLKEAGSYQLSQPQH